VQLPVAAAELLLVKEQGVVQERKGVEYVKLVLSASAMPVCGQSLTFFARMRASLMSSLSRTFSFAWSPWKATSVA
jgi:hypothetical protein